MGCGGIYRILNTELLPMRRFIEWKMQSEDGCCKHRREALCAIQSLVLIGNIYFGCSLREDSA